MLELGEDHGGVDHLLDAGGEGSLLNRNLFLLFFNMLLSNLGRMVQIEWFLLFATIL